jgi:hypothetical protein
MTGPESPESHPAPPWGKVAAVAGGVAAAGLTFKGGVVLTRVAFGEVRYRLLQGRLPARWS